MADATEAIKEIWHKYPAAVIAVAGGGVLLLISLARKNQSAQQAPGVDNTPVTYQIYGSTGGVSGGGGGGPPPPAPNPDPVYNCPPGYHWYEGQGDQVGRCISNILPTPSPNPPPDPAPGPLPTPGGGTGRHCPPGEIWCASRGTCFNPLLQECETQVGGPTDMMQAIAKSQKLF